MVSPARRVTTSSQWVEATARKFPAASEWHDQTRSMKGEEEGRSESNEMSTGEIVPQGATSFHRCENGTAG